MRGVPPAYISESMAIPTHSLISARCFEPVAAPGAEILILGSMPGQASLRMTAYYAHPRNAFWPIMGAIFGAGPGIAYPERLRLLQSRGIALWDVLAACDRRGSLDADIATDSIVVNDFGHFLDQHPSIRRIVFNGATAERCYRRHVPVAVQRRIEDLRRLPSTSPAHAGMRFDEKLADWRAALTI